MSEKHLTELPWKTLVTKQKIKDPGLGKAMAAYAACGEKDHEGRLKAMEEIAKQAKAIKAEQKKSKEIVAYLEEVLKETVKGRQALDLLMGAKAKESGGGGGGETDDEAAEKEAAEYKKNLKSKLLGAMSQVKASAPKPGEAPAAPLQFTAYLVGADCAVLVGKAGGSAWKMLPSVLGGATGGKYVRGDCIFEEGAHTFVVDAIPGGFAQKLTTALAAETGAKFKVRVRTADGSASDEAGGEKAPDGEKGGGEAGWTARRGEIEAAYLAALKEQPGNADKLRATLAFADGAAESGDYAKALQSLDSLEKLMGGGGPQPNAALTQEWQAACKTVKDLLRQVQDALTKSGDLNAKPAVLRLQSVGKNLAAAPATQQEVTELERWINEDEVITLAETPNPFGIPVKIRETLLPILQSHKPQLPA